MNKVRSSFVMLLTAATTIVCIQVRAQAQQQRASQSVSRKASMMKSRLTGAYRLDVGSSDKLYSVVTTASSNLPSAEQQRFFDDLTIRLAAPDQLAIERRGNLISLASSRAPRLSFAADGIERTEQATDGRTIRTRAALNADQLTVTTSGSSEDKFTVVFEPIDVGRRLNVTRRIAAAGLNQPVVIRSIYNKVSDVARWSIYGETQPVSVEPPASTSATVIRSTSSANLGSNDANVLRAALDEWIAATNARDLNRQLTFYMPRVEAYYLARNVSRDFVRAEKTRVFARASTVDVRAAAPEILFADAGRMAIMRFRKQYVIEGGKGNRRGEVVQELRWRKTNGVWKIASERDVRVLR